MGRKRLATRAPEDIADKLEEYCSDEQTPDISKSEAMRRFITGGLVREGFPVETADGGTARRIDALEKRQSVASLSNKVYILMGVAYIVATLSLPVGGWTWVATGVIVMSLLLYGSHKYQMSVGK